MQPKSETENRIPNRVPADHHTIPSTTVLSEPWWRTVGYNPTSPTVTGRNASNSSLLECPKSRSESSDDRSVSDDGSNEDDDDANKESQMTSPQSVENHGQIDQDVQHVSSTVPTVRDDCIAQPPQLELIGHSIACSSNPYQDPYYAGMIAPYGQQPLDSV